MAVTDVWGEGTGFSAADVTKPTTRKRCRQRMKPKPLIGGSSTRLNGFALVTDEDASATKTRPENGLQT
jgi:hypothetical protein